MNILFVFCNFFRNLNSDLNIVIPVCVFVKLFATLHSEDEDLRVLKVMNSKNVRIFFPYSYNIEKLGKGWSETMRFRTNNFI